MKVYGFPLQIIGLIFFFLVISVSGATRSHAAEEWEKFLQRLIEKEYFDTGQEYLELMRTSTLAPAELASQIDYQQGRLALLSVGTSKDPLKQLNISREFFARFLQDHPDHVQADQARETLARIITKDADLDLFKSSAESEKVLRVRSDYQQARELYDQLVNAAKIRVEELDNQIKEEKDQRAKQVKSNERDETVYRYVDYRMMTMELDAKIARTFPQDSEEYQAGLKKAAADFHRFHVAYNNYPGISFLAKFHEAKSLYELGEIEKSKSLLQEMTGIGVEFQKLKTEILALLLKINNEEQNYSDSLERVALWEKDTLPAERTSLEGQQILLWGARAAVEISNDASQNRERINSAKKVARKFLDILLDPKLDSLLRAEAEKLQSSLDGKKTQGKTTNSQASSSGSRKRPETFEDGVEWVRNMIEQYGDRAAALEEAEDVAQQEKIKQQLKTARKQIIAHVDYVLSLRGPKETQEFQEDLVFLLFNQAILYWEEQYFDKANVLFNHVAESFPESHEAPEAALNAIKALRMMIMNERFASRDVSDLLEHMKTASQSAAHNWKDDIPVEELTLLLVDAYVDAGMYDEALMIINRLPNDSEHRTRAEIRVAITLWGNYLKGLRADEAARPSETEMTRLRETVKKLLDNAIPKCEALYKDAMEFPSKAVLYAVRYYAQIFLREEHNPEQAIAWLTNETIGPVSFIIADDRIPDDDEPIGGGVFATDSDGLDNEFKIGTLMELLQAQVRGNHLDEAEKTMTTLDNLVTQEGGEIASRLVVIYYQLGKELEDQLDQLTRGGKAKEAQSVSEGFNLFLTRISERKEGNTYYTLSWAADTFFRLGKGLSKSLDPQQQAMAREYLSKAGKAYLAIRKRLLDEPDWGPQDAYRMMTLRMSECLRARNNPEDCKIALTEIAKLLKENENFIDLQMEAANIYQTWAADPKFSNYYVKAIVGGLPNAEGKNLVWGWNGIIRILSASNQFEQFQNLFYEANYNKAQARLLLAQTKTDKEREDLLKGAEAELLRLYQLRPDLGGPEWFAKFNAYLINLRKLLGDPSPQGFRAS